MKRKLVLLGMIVLLGACGGKEETPLPTAISKEDALATAGLPSDADLTATAATPLPTQTVIVTWTPSPTITLTPSETATPTLTPTETVTLSPIQMTEMFLYERGTSAALTATAQVPPTESRTPTETPLPSAIPSATATPTATPILPNVSPPNRVIFTSNRTGTNDIWLMELDGSNPITIMLALESNENVATCSPDGEQFVFDSDRGGDLELYLGRYDGSDPRPITDTEGENFHPVWSPDGSMIAFVSSRTGDNDIWVMDNGGGNPRAITTAVGADQNPQWSPDGTQLYYASNRDGQSEIYRYDFATNTETRLTETEERDETAPAFGFDFRTLVYIADLEAGESSTGALWVDNLTDEPVASVSAEGRVDQPVWIADGKLLLSADLGGITQVLLVDLLEASRTILTNIGPRNFWPHPCYVKSEESTAALPTGIPPSLTPTPIEERISAYIPIGNPGEEWERIRNTFDTSEFADLDDVRLQQAEVTFENERLIFTWQAGEDVFSVMLLPEIVEGALEVSVTSYTRNEQPEDLFGVQDLAFLVREFMLSDTIPAGSYSVESLSFEESGMVITLSIPPQ